MQVKNLCTSFDVDAGEVRAVNGISFSLDKGKVLGIVGESGSGKSVTAYSIMRILVEPGRIKSGEILFDGQDIVKFSKKQMSEFRGKRISIIFQDPMTSLNPTVHHRQPACARPFCCTPTATMSRPTPAPWRCSSSWA